MWRVNDVLREWVKEPLPERLMAVLEDEGLLDALCQRLIELEDQLENVRRVVTENERGPDLGWTHRDEPVDDLRRKLHLVLGDGK